MPTVSIVMTTFNRPVQLERTLQSIWRQNYPGLEVVVVDDGNDAATPVMCKWVTQYIKLNRPKHPQGYVRTPARPNNIGVRAAHGDIIILQNAECEHVDPQCIEKLVSKVIDTNAVFARVTALKADRKFKMIYCGTPEREVGWFFCGCLKKALFEKVGGFEEEFSHSGYDDNDFEVRMKEAGVEFVWTDTAVNHQWHVSGGKINIEPMRKLFERKQHERSIRSEILPG